MPKQKSRPEPYNSVTVKQIEQWTSSFDSLLSSERGRDMFMDHLLHEGNERHLEFWLRCEQLNQQHQRLRAEAADIYDQFLDIDAPKKVNVYAEAEAAWTKLESKADNFGVFEQAQYKIKARMEQDSFPGFCQQLMKLKKSLK